MPHGDLVELVSRPCTSTLDPLETSPRIAVGTLILTVNGELPVEFLQAGDEVMTRDHGLQRVVRVDMQMLSDAELRVDPTLCPIMITRNALGPGLPCRDLLVAPAQRLWVRHGNIRMGGPSQIVTARALSGHTKGVFVDETAMMAAGVEYFAVVLDQPCIIWAEGLAVESLGLKSPSPHVASLRPGGREEVERLSSALA
ncbi:MAG: Hint domain-containing protein [Deltaproteobacteria bacterium]